MPQPHKTLPQLLQSIREEAGVSVRELAAAAEVSPDTIYRIESGKRPDTQGILLVYGRLVRRKYG
jgi:DNA-binding XRE family transcriptional regulator